MGILLPFRMFARLVVLWIPRLSRPAAQDFNDLEQVAVYQRGYGRLFVCFGTKGNKKRY
jgi:hypothetical protein